MELFLIMLLVFFIAHLGYIFILLARKSRAVNEKLRKTGDATSNGAHERMKREGVTKDNLKNFYCGNLTPAGDLLTRILAISVIVAIVGFNVFIAIIFYLKR